MLQWRTARAGTRLLARNVVDSGVLVTLYGVAAVTFMMTMYALERRSPTFVLAFAVGCVMSSVYGFLAGAWPFGVVELIWAIIAARRWSGERTA